METASANLAVGLGVDTIFWAIDSASATHALSIKGRANYVCERRLDAVLAEGREPSIFEADRMAYAVMLSCAVEDTVRLVLPVCSNFATFFGVRISLSLNSTPSTTTLPFVDASVRSSPMC